MPRLLYVAFDELSAPKGASTHIREVVQALGRRYGDVTLVSPGMEDQPPKSLFPGVRQSVLGCPDDNLLGRVRIFRAKLQAFLQRERFDLAQFRAPWEGVPLVAERARSGLRLIYEVNGLPSIELKYHHRAVSDSPELIAKIAGQEKLCLEAADGVIVVSEVNRQAVLSRGAQPEKTQLAPNGVDLARFPFQLPPPPGERFQIAYIGTFSPWQGVEQLLEAVALLNKHRPATLTLLGFAARKRVEQLQLLARQLGIGELVFFPQAGSTAEVLALLHASHATAAPLLAVDRNTVQGCCPLKVLEAFAAGCPLVASELPVVCELATRGVHFEPARAGDPRSLKNAFLRLAEDWPQTLARAAAARTHVASRFTWDDSHGRLLALYQRLLGE